MPASTLLFLFCASEGQPGSWAVVPLGNRRCWVTIIVVGSAALAGMGLGVCLGYRVGASWGWGRTCGQRKKSGPQVSNMVPGVLLYLHPDGPYSLQLSSSPTDFSGILSAEIGSQVEMECISIQQNPSTAGCTMALS